MTEFETAMVNEPSGFKPLKFYCNMADQNRLVIFFLSNTPFIEIKIG